MTHLPWDSLDVLIEIASHLDPLTSRVVECTWKNGKLAVFKQWVRLWPTVPDLMRRATRVIDKLETREAILCDACRTGSIELLEWLIARFNDARRNRLRLDATSMYSAAILGGQDAMIDWLDREKFGRDDPMAFACGQVGRMDLLRRFFSPVGAAQQLYVLGAAKSGALLKIPDLWSNIDPCNRILYGLWLKCLDLFQGSAPDWFSRTFFDDLIWHVEHVEFIPDWLQDGLDERKNYVRNQLKSYLKPVLPTMCTSRDPVSFDTVLMLRLVSYVRAGHVKGLEELRRVLPAPGHRLLHVEVLFKCLRFSEGSLMGLEWLRRFEAGEPWEPCIDLDEAQQTKIFHWIWEMMAMIDRNAHYDLQMSLPLTFAAMSWYVQIQWTLFPPKLYRRIRDERRWDLMVILFKRYDYPSVEPGQSLYAMYKTRM